MQELTSNRYETLYPKTVTRQVDGINNYDWQIGDIRSTARTDLGDKWLLCNGSVIDTSNEYSDVGDLLGKSAGSWVLENTADTTKIFSSNLSSSINVDYVNGKYVAMGIDFSNSNNVIAKVAYSDTLDGEWSESSLPNPSMTNPQHMSGGGVTFLNRTYYAGAIIFIQYMTYITVIWTSTDLKNWTISYNSGNKSWRSGGVGKITASSNKIVMPIQCFATTNSIEYSQIWVAQMSTTNNTWNMVQLYSSDNSKWSGGDFVVSVANDNLFISYWVSEPINTSMQNYSIQQLIFNSTSAQGWSRSTFLGPDSSGMNRGVSQTNVSNVIYINGTYYIVGTHTFSGYNYNSIGYGDLYSSTSSTTGTMTWNLSSTQDKNKGKVVGLIKQGDYYIFYDNGNFSQMNILSSDLSDAVAIVNVKSLTQIRFLSTSQFIGLTSNATVLQKCKLMEWTSILPNITVDKGYVYIKVKEGE